MMDRDILLALVYLTMAESEGYDRTYNPSSWHLLEISWALQELPLNEGDKDNFQKLLKSTSQNEDTANNPITKGAVLIQALSLMKNHEKTDPLYLLLEKAKKHLEIELNFRDDVSDESTFETMMSALVILKDGGILHGEHGMFYLDSILDMEEEQEDWARCFVAMNDRGLLNATAVGDKNRDSLEGFECPKNLLNSLQRVTFLMETPEMAQECFDTLIELDTEFDGILDTPLDLLINLNLLTLENLKNIKYTHIEALEKLTDRQSILLNKENAQNTYNIITRSSLNFIYYVEYFAAGLSTPEALTLFSRLKEYEKVLDSVTSEELENKLEAIESLSAEKIVDDIKQLPPEVAPKISKVFLHKAIIKHILESILNLCDLSEEDSSLFSENISFYIEGVFSKESNLKERECVKNTDNFLKQLIDENVDKILASSRLIADSLPHPFNFYTEGKKRKGHFLSEDSKRFKDTDESIGENNGLNSIRIDYSPL